MPQQAIAERIEKIILAFPESEAFNMASHDSSEAEAARGELTFNIMINLLKAFAIECIVYEAPTPTHIHNGWKMWEFVRSDEQPAHR